MQAGRAPLADDAKTLREPIDLVKKGGKGDDLQKSRLFWKQSVATYVDLEFRGEPSKHARDRSEHMNRKKEKAVSDECPPWTDYKR